MLYLLHFSLYATDYYIGTSGGLDNFQKLLGPFSVVGIFVEFLVIPL